MSAPDPKPVKRHKADVDEWKILRKLKLGPCRVCGFYYNPRAEITLHHLVSRSLGGSDVPANLVPLCGSGTTGHHGAVEAAAPVSCGKLRESLTEAEIAYIVETKSEAWLDRRYPRRSAEDVQPTASAEISV